jgi:hypothetical protein
MGTVTYSGTDNLTATTYTAGEAWWRCADARIVEAYSFAACFEAIGVVRAHDRRRLALAAHDSPRAGTTAVSVASSTPACHDIRSAVVGLDRPNL